VQRASNDDIIVGMRWELGDLIIDRSNGLRDGDGEKYQRLRVEAYGDSPQPEHRSILNPLYTHGKRTWDTVDATHQ